MGEFDDQNRPLGEISMHAFLFTDVEGSTRKWQQKPDVMGTLLAHHQELIQAAVERHEGRVFKHTGDGCCAVFSEAPAAIAAAVAAQLSLQGLGLTVRMGIDAGAAVAVGADYLGLSLNRCARVTATAQGGQVLVSGTAEQLARDGLAADIELLDLGEHVLRDLDQPERLFQVVSGDLPRQFPPLRSAVMATPLPRALSTLVGRIGVIAEVSHLLNTERLVTLAAVGGSGKTRVALEVAHRTRDRFAHGVAFVDLVPLRDSVLVPEAAAEALAMPPSQAPVSVGDVVQFVGSRNLLVVLDNCEHLLEASADLVHALASKCQAARILVTSREPLGIDGERVVHLPGLDAHESQTLFVERAGSTLGTQADEGIVPDICDRLDGLPLAIELAAAQARHLPLHEVRSLLDDRLQLLTSGRRQQPRHRTLDAMMDWSYELLDEDAQTLLRVLSVFAGSFTLDAVEAVCSRTDNRRVATAARLGALVDKSLVVLNTELGRLSLLETVRLYAAEKLQAAGETKPAHGRLAEWLLDTSPGQWWWARTPKVAQAELELDNLRAAMDWCHATGDTALLTRLAASYGVVWFVTTRAAEGLRWVKVAQEQDAVLDVDTKLAWRTTAAWCQIVMMDGVAAQAVAEDGLALASDDHPAIAPLQCVAAWMQGWVDPTAAHDRFDRVRAAAHNVEMWRANADYLEGHVHLQGARFDEALRLLRSASLGHACIHPVYPVIGSVVCLHFLERDEDAQVLLEEARRAAGDGRWYFLDLAIPFVQLLLAAGAHQWDETSTHLEVLIRRTRDRYPHLPNAWGFAVQGAIIASSVAGDPHAAATLYGGSQALGLHRRYEGATVAGRVYGKRALSALSNDAATAALERGRSLSVDGLVAVAATVARSLARDQGANP